MNDQAGELKLGLWLTVGANCLSLIWVAGVLALGGLAQATGGFSNFEGDPWGLALGMVFWVACCPACLTAGLFGVGALRKSPRFLLGWLIGALVSAAVIGCLTLGFISLGI